MTNPTNSDIMRTLGGLEAEMKHARESRGIIHQKLEGQNVILDETAKTLAKVNFAVETTTAIAMQARDVADAALKNLHRFETEFRENQLPIIAGAAAFKMEAEPVLRTIKMVRTIVVALLAMGVLSIGSVVALALTAREWLAFGLRWVLGL